MGEREKVLVIEALTERFPEVEAFVEEILEEAGCPVSAAMQVGLAVEEIYVNVAHYAYEPGTGDVTIRVVVTEDPSAVTLTFTDSGKPYDPLAREDPDVTLSAEEREIGGLGIFLTKKMMDQVSYEYKDGCNVFSMTKQW